ncbi:hypothetical protein H4Q26_006458 [Puccinia striiformis f. sp. tritici PST-130]|nr:hypothetical protein H4Q26_006458 [Puccinia striiformis f. sp. tritici PST-130]
MALPNGVCKPFVDAISSVPNSQSVIVDLSADYRFENGWTYGLPELYDRESIRRSKRISNPGCYATNMQLLLAGTSKGNQPKISPEQLNGFVRPYSLTDHIHEREASHHLNRLTSSQPNQEFEVGFIPSIAPWFSGIIMSASIPLNTTSLSAKNFHEIFESKYHNEKLLQWNRNGANRLVVVGVLDNLLKGAATQCLQHNIRLIFGHSDPANCAANEIAELHLGILNAIETQAREAEHKVNILTQQVNYIVEQIKTLRTRLGKLDLDSDLHIDQEALGPKLDRIYSILADQTLIRSHSNTKFMSKTYSKIGKLW